MLHLSMMKEQLFRGGHILEDWQLIKNSEISEGGSWGMEIFNTIIDFFINSIFDHNKDSL